MPPSTVHFPATGIDDAHDWFNRRVNFGILPAAAATALVNASALPAAPAHWTPASGGFTAGAAGVVTYGARGVSVTTPSTTSSNGVVNNTYQGSSGWYFAGGRTLQYVCSGAQSGNVVTTGLDRFGNVITETVALNGSTPVLGTKAFEFVFDILVPTKSASETISIGTGNGIGLGYPPLDADSGLRGYKGSGGTTKDSSAGTLDATNNTWTPATAPNGTDTYVLVYQSVK